MQVTFDLPDDVVAQLHPLEDKLPQVLELGLRELNAIAQVGFSRVAEVLEFLASLPIVSTLLTPQKNCLKSYARYTEDIPVKKVKPQNR